MSNSSEAAHQSIDSASTAELIARRFGKRGHRFDRCCATLAGLIGSQPAVIRNWLVGQDPIEGHVEERLAAWVMAGMPLPDHPSVGTGRRLDSAPLKELSAAAAKVLGSGNRTALLLGAASFSPAPPVVVAAREAVASLHHSHKERLLESLNRSLLEAGRQPL